MLNNIIQKRLYTLTCYILATIIGILFLFPIFLLASSSIKPLEDVFDLSLIPKIISFAGYKHSFEIEIGRFMLNSVFISTTVTVIALILHSMAAYPLARMDFRGKKTVFAWMLSTLIVPFPVIMIPLFILVRYFGWLDTYRGIIIPAIPHAYGIFLFRQFYLAIPKELEDAASIDGCGPFTTYRKIFIPLSKPITITVSVAFFIANWNNYLWPLIVNNDRRLWVMQVAIANFISHSGTRWDAVLASGFLSVLPTIVVFFVLQRYLVEGIKMTGIK